MKIKLIILLCAFVFNTAAQTKQEAKTIFGNGKPHIGYFINPSFQVGNFAGSTAIIPGIGAGVLFNNKLSASILYKFTLTENTPAGEPDQLYLHGQWFGLKAEYSIKPESVVHVSFPLEIDAGEIEFDIKDSYENQAAAAPSGEAWFVNIEPGIAAEINLWKYLRLNLGAGYRFVSDIKFSNVSGSDMMGFTFSAGLKIGLF